MESLVITLEHLLQDSISVLVLVLVFVLAGSNKHGVFEGFRLLLVLASGRD